MFSDPVPPSTAPVTTAGASDAPAAAPTGTPAKTPLDILEEILGQDPTAAGQNPLDATAAAPANSSDSPPVDEQAGLPPEPPKLTAEQIDALEAERQLHDQAQLAAKQAEMAQIFQTPQYQAKMAQENAAEAQEQQHEVNMDGFEIVQLKHTKIPDPTQPQPT